MTIKGLQVSRMQELHKPGYKFPVETRIQAVTQWLALGNMRQVAALTGVSYPLLRRWKSEEWWAELVNEIKAARDTKVDNKLSKIIDRSLSIVDDRLASGEIKVNKKTGDVYREPVSALTAHKIGNDLISRQIDISQKRVEETNSRKSEKIEDTLKMLALEFAKFNTKRTINVQAKDVSDANERTMGQNVSRGETRLQTSDTGASEEESGLLAGIESEELFEESWGSGEDVPLDEYSGEEETESSSEIESTELSNETPNPFMGR